MSNSRCTTSATTKSGAYKDRNNQQRYMASAYSILKNHRWQMRKGRLRGL